MEKEIQKHIKQIKVTFEFLDNKLSIYIIEKNEEFVISFCVPFLILTTKKYQVHLDT